jgi:hypothetical protein
MSHDALESAFNQEMLSSYQRALSEADCKASRFLALLMTHDDLEAALPLIDSSTISGGYSALSERKRSGNWRSGRRSVRNRRVNKRARQTAGFLF